MFSQFSVSKPYTIIVAVAIVAILGVVSITNMSTDLLPSFNLPFAVVSTPYIGASPEVVEQVVTRPIEQSMASISNIKTVRSISREHMSIVILEFAETTNMDSAIIEMRESLDMVTLFMPSEVGSTMILKLNPDMMPVMVVSVAIEGQDIAQSSSYFQTNLIPELESVEGIAAVSVTGLVENEIHVILQDEKIANVNENLRQAMLATMLPSSGQIPLLDEGDAPVPPLDEAPYVPQVSITKDMVSGILKGQNFSMPAGYITEDGVSYLVRAGDRIGSIEELEQLPVMSLPITGIPPIVLSDVADVFLLDNSDEMYTKVNGNDAVILTIQKQTEYSTADVAQSVRTRINEIMAREEGVQIVPLMDQGEYVDMVVNSMGRNLIIGGLLALLILLIFLRDIKPTIVAGFSIPISLVTAFVMMYFSGVTLNVVSMGGLALGVGMLVDNSIVVIENIYRMKNEGENIKEAAVKGAQQVSGAIIASTLTTVSVFVPILFTQGITRQIFSDMGLTITFSLLASLVVALTLVPMMASKIMNSDIREEQKILDKVKTQYTKVLTFSLQHKWVVVTLALALLVGSIIGAFNAGTEFFPASDTGQLTVNITMPEGSAFEETVASADRTAMVIAEIEDVETVGASIGGSMGMFGGMGFAGAGGGYENVSLYVLLREDKVYDTSEIAQLIRDKTADFNYDISVVDSSMDMTSLGGAGVSVSIRGREFDTLESSAQEVATLVRGVTGTVDVSDGLEQTSPELRIIVDREKSISYGLTTAQLFMAVHEFLGSDDAVTSLSIGVNDYSIYVKDSQGEVSVTQQDLSQLQIATPQGGKVKVSEIATITEAAGFSSINRLNQQRYVTVTAQIAEGYNIGLVSRDIEGALTHLELPEGYSLVMGGENAMIQDAFRDLYLMLALGVVFIYLIMVAQFQSLLSPFIVMFTIPLAFTGGFFGLMATGNPVSIVAFIGLIVLAGVVVNNGIVFVDYINILKASGMEQKEAIILAGNTRLRPIVMTALTTIFALSTMSVGVGMGTEMVQPMAITAIGGLIYATALTLILVPVLYDAFNRKGKIAGDGLK